MDESQAMRIFRTFNAGAEPFRVESRRHEGGPQGQQKKVAP
jgi:hypothetical protein